MAQKTHWGPATKTLLSSIALALSVTPAAALDLDSNGLCDVWEARYHTAGLLPDADTDGDGFTNAAESTAGTDPRDPNSHHASVIDMTGGDIHVTVTTQPGKKYQLQRSASPNGPWTNEGAAIVATGLTHQFSPPQSGGVGFFHVTVSDADGDSDGIDDWAELQLAGFDKSSGNSFASGTDLAIATEMIAAWKSGLTVEATDAIAYEKDHSAAKLTFTRPTAAAYPFTVFLKTSGATNSTKSSASASDVTLKDSAAQTVLNRLVIPAGSASAILNIEPTEDALVEVPEQLHFAVGGSTQTSSITICDAKNTIANQKLLIAYLHPVTGVTSNGGGLATIRLQGDNDLAVVSVSFSNLNSAVNSTQVLNAASSILQSVPPANYTGQTWAIRASQSFLTDQAVLDSLLGGNIKLGVFTEAYVNGEIEGAFQPAGGSIEFQIPADPSPPAILTGSDLERDIVRFLTQSTFGPTLESIADLKARVTAANGNRIAAYSTWIDDQFAKPTTALLPYVKAADRQEIELYADPTKTYYKPSGFDPVQNNRRRGWWLLALSAQDQLRQRLGFALSEIFVISDAELVINNRSHGAAAYFDMLRTSSDGSFRTLLEDVSKNPMMGHYLSHRGNQKATYSATGALLTSPDENYAREIMQLFSIGLVNLHPDGSLKLDATGSPIPTYGQTDITEMARVFTGWSYSKRNSPGTSETVIDNTTFTYGYGSPRYESQWTNPMKIFADKHDVGSKSMIGLTLPANQTGEKDLADVVTYLANHPNTAPFISRRLIQRLVTANPSAGYLYRVSKAFKDSNGDLGDTVKAILLDPEARSLDSATTLASSGKTREPILKTTAFLRAFNAKSKLPLADLTAYGYPTSELAKFPAGTMRARFSATTSNLGQTPMAPPTVFNWFLPDYSPPGILSTNGLVSPELQLANETSVVYVTNFLYSPIYGSVTATSSVPNQNEEPFLYGANAHYLLADYTSLEALYMAVVDKNNDGLFTSLDTATFNNVPAITTACEAVLDRIDLLLCGGNLKARYGNTVGKPRKLMLDAIVGTRSSSNNSNSATNQRTYMLDRIKAAVWLVVSSPEFAVQK